MSARDQLAGLVGAFKGAHLDARRELRDEEHDAAYSRREAFIDAFEDHGRDVLAGFMDHLPATENLPGWLAPIVNNMRAPRSFTASTEILAGVAAIVYSVVNRLVEPPLQPVLNEEWSKLPNIPLSPAEVALNRLRGGHFKDAGEHEASLSGLNAERFAVLVENTGEPISKEEALFLFRRGKLSAGDVEHAIRQSRIRDEWIPAVMDLRYGPPSSSEAINGAVRNLLTDDEARRIVSENGIDPDNYDWLRAAAGRPPGIEQMLHLLNRNIVSEAEVVQAIRESDIKDKYIPAILASRRHLMPQEQVIRAVRHGAFTEAEGVERLLMLGFAPEDADALVKLAHTEKTSGERDLSESLVTRGYASGLLTRADAHAHLVELGYDDTEADFVLDVHDAALLHAQHDAAVNRVRGLFLSHRLDATETATALVNLGVPGGQGDELVKLWTIERDANVAELTLAQLDWALKAEWITPEDYLDRLSRRGYTVADATILAARATGTTRADVSA